ncbi:unnamed protein product [Pieris macdunnoughi]|uniref:Uncharacterized protein n=1 Tax=Pieris macdunnoughi TaxID=345717 RepID=A0A821Y0Q9_9NEOP|nr:unnamed protein product [Pieris macdunnoughi]
MANVKKKQTREERLEKKRQTEKLRYQRIKNDPVKNAKLKEKERQQYKKKKEKGQIKSINDMTEREQRAVRKIWREKTKKHRDRVKIQSTRNNPLTPPASDNEDQPPLPQNNIALAAKRRSEIQRKLRNQLIKKQKYEIKQLRQKVRDCQKKLRRIGKQKMTPNSKVADLLQNNSKENIEEVKKKLLFSEVIQNQLKENINLTTNDNEKKIFKKVLSGKVVKKYKVLNQINMKPIRQSSTANKSLLDMTRKTRNDKTNSKLEKKVAEFFEEDCNSRLCPGKKDSITKGKIKRQKRLLQDTMKNLHTKFINTKNIKLSYTLFCRLRPFWVVTPNIHQRETCLCVTHANMELTLASLKQADIIDFPNYQSMLNYLCCDRYNEKCLMRECLNCNSRSICYREFDNSVLIKYSSWQCITEDILDTKTMKKRRVRKYKKITLNCAPKDIVMKLEENLDIFLKHEANIVHQYETIKRLKDNLTEKDAVIHMDFSENYNTKYSSEVQSFHFGGSRTQISLHTVVLYTKGETKCFATMSENLNHNVPVIWAHLKPVMKLLPSSVENVHFLSDGPVTQYRNKDMFFYLLCKLTETYPNIYDFTWNYHEAGHGKGAPDGIGGTCKRTADKIVALGTDIATIDDFATELNKSCPGIKIFVIPEEEIDFQKKIMEDNRPNIKPFTGTLKVHQVRGNYLRNTLYMKSLSCFCSNFCPHFHLGDIKYPQNKKNKLDVDAVYTDSEEDVQNKIVAQTSTHVINTIDNADTAMTVKNGDFVLVEYNINNKKYRYAGISNEDATFFRINDNDVSDVKWEQILTILPVPNIRMKGNRVFYKFPKPVDVFEK